jgi:hypothetical protein
MVKSFVFDILCRGFEVKSVSSKSEYGFEMNGCGEKFTVRCMGNRF